MKENKSLVQTVGVLNRLGRRWVDLVYQPTSRSESESEVLGPIALAGQASRAGCPLTIAPKTSSSAATTLSEHFDNTKTMEIA